MDLRQKKTLARIYHGFSQCLSQKDYAEITVQDILSNCGVSRSAFYAHFRTKDDVLESFLWNMFHHVFSHSLEQEDSHDFSQESVLDYRHLFTHIFYHLRDERELISSILKSSCRDSFFALLRQSVAPLVERCVKEGAFVAKDLPEALRIASAIESFIALVAFWFQSDCRDDPEKATEYLFELNN